MDERNDLKQKELWQEEGFDSYLDYEDWYVSLVEDLLAESQNAWREIKRKWNEADKRLELEGSKVVASPTKSDLPVVPQAVEEAVALLVESLPRPQSSPRQASQEEFSGALNFFLNQELDANDFDLLMAKVALDMKRFNLGCVKQSVDEFQTGIFDQLGRIIITKVDPRYVWPDPFARGWRWDDMRYLIVAEPMDLSEIRQRWPGKGWSVEPESEYTVSRSSEAERDEEEPTELLFRSHGDFTLKQRHRARVKELWLKDDSLRFEPDRNPETGEEIKDEDGKTLGQFVKKYPNGRLIIIANGKLLIDQPNPFDHGEPPYSFFPNRITGRLLSWGDIELLARIEDKLNQLHKDIILNLRTSMNSPIVIDRHAFDSPQKFKNITNSPSLVLPVASGARVMRLPPGEVPQFTFPFLDWLKGVFDDVLGVQPVLRGQIEKGSQMSAEGVQQLQVSAQARLRLKSRFFENSLKHVGHLLQYNIRQFYPSNMQAVLVDPRTKQEKVVNWNEDAAKANYLIEMEAGSSLPGAKESGKQSLVSMYKEGLLSKSYVLRGLQIPGAENEIKYQEEREEKLAMLGFDASTKRNTSGSAGRRSQKAAI